MIKPFVFSFLILSLPFSVIAEPINVERESFDFSDLETGTDEFGSYSIGHNLSTNARTLKKGQTSVGTLYFAHGLTDEWSFGTSPFVFESFKMFNLMSRHGFKISETQRMSVDIAYFKTFGGKQLNYNQEACYYNESIQDIDCYDVQGVDYVGFLMEAINGKVTYSQQMAPYYRFNSTLSYFYFWDDRSPFSFRMDPANPDPYTFNFSTLHEFRIVDSIYLNYELGLWGINYQYPYMHTGLTIGLQTFNWLISFGMSTTYSFSFPERRLHNFPAGYNSQASYHPEFEIQYFF